MVREEAERCDTLRYSWERLNAQAAEVSSHLLAIQPQFKQELIENVKVFITDCNDFYSNYDKVSVVVNRLGIEERKGTIFVVFKSD